MKKTDRSESDYSDVRDVLNAGYMRMKDYQAGTNEITTKWFRAPEISW